MTKNEGIRGMENAIIMQQTVAEAGLVANHIATRNTFNDYQLRKSTNTLRAQRGDLGTFAEYLCAAGVTGAPNADELQNYADAWQGVTWGLVSGFTTWLMGQGVALTSLNRKLSTVKVYAGLAAVAGIISGNELALIQTVKGYAQKEFRKVDAKRTVTRQGNKKLKSTAITKEDAKALKVQPATPQGRRDAVIMALLLDHGLRVGELVNLSINDIDLANKEIVFFRAKVDVTQRHALTPDTLKAIKAYIQSGDAPAMGALLRSSVKGGALAASGMTERSVWVRVGELGKRVGIENFSPHDCRHYWATKAVRKGANPFELMQAGGWTSMQTVKKYVDENTVANAGISAED